jgi:putative tryptophan/tyrosine transport system substrate-binding protein
MQSGQLQRREFITLLGGATAGWPLSALAQQPAMPVIGYLSGRSPEAEARLREPFIKALETSGFAAGRNVAIEYRFAEGQDDRFPALAADLVRERPAVLVAMDTGSALATKAATKTIPIVFGVGADPVRLGLVESLNRPGGNATGIYVFVTDLGPKRLQLLREVVPHARLIAFIVNLNTASGPAQKSEMESAARAIGQQILVLSVSTESEVNEAFATIDASKADAIVYSAGVFFQVVRDRLVALAARHSIPAIYEWPEFATAGGLMSYSSSRLESSRQIGNYTAQILKGAKPADLPVTQSSKFELVINRSAEFRIPLMVREVTAKSGKA